MQTLHACNPWCFGGLHAILFDTEASERAVLEQIAGRLAAGQGYSYVGHAEVRPAGAPAPGQPSKEGVTRGRVVIWAR